MFSPYYAWANRKSPAPAENFCAMNLALYDKRGGHWAMTERNASQLARTAGALTIGPSNLYWDGKTLSANLDEITAPIPRRIKGTLRLTPAALQPQTFTLDAAGRHRWRPIAPAARIDIDFSRPGIAWSGHAYLDSNDGDAPLAEDFREWHWSRAQTAGGATILYDIIRRDGSDRALALNVAADGTATSFTPPPPQPLPRTAWGITRRTRADAGHPPRLIQNLENAPFYARAKIRARLAGAEAEAIHESLSLDRFTAPWVQAMLPFRMPRRWGDKHSFF